MTETQKNIKKVVDDYKLFFPDEYALVVEMIKGKKNTVDEFASVDGMFDGRVLYEIPETLSKMLTKNLVLDDLTWLKSGGFNKKEGGRWFARTFREFSLAESI